ncbi:hypothetical protein BKA70DRAFT_1421764 [Coprinopsis sp. MPI-PUGE-AT-0042]|nr:hypothetical protein BKA70DRAFT_1421764 [Coprinopsis sp. MPI-PUGE-AT-0042]
MPRNLPSEVTDMVLDALAASDPLLLCSCALVSSSWLPRSRFHLFSTLHLKPSHVSPLVALFKESRGDLPRFVRHIVLDGNLLPPQCCPDDANLERTSTLATGAPDTQALVNALASLASADLQLTSLSLQRIDFTLIPPKQVAQIQQHLASSSFAPTLENLIFEDTTFQSFKQVHTLLHLFPSLQGATFAKRVAFLRHRDFACVEATNLPWKAGLKHIRIEAENDENVVPIILSWIASSHDLTLRALQTLSIDGFHESNLPLLENAMARVAPHLQHLELRLSRKLTRLSRDTLATAVAILPSCRFDCLPQTVSPVLENAVLHRVTGPYEVKLRSNSLLQTSHSENMRLIQGFDVGITIDGRQLDEYQLESAEAFGAPSATCYIPSQAGKDFEVIVRAPPCPRPGNYHVGLMLDGVWPNIRDPNSIAKGSLEGRVTLRGHEARDNALHPFQFADVKLTDNDTALHERFDRLGEITVGITRYSDSVLCRNPSCSPIVEQELSTAPVHERQKKGLVAHRVKYGEPRTLPSARQVQRHHVLLLDAKLEATVTFKYRKLAILVAQGIAPRHLLPESVEHRLGESSGGPANLRRRDGFDVEGLSDLEDYYRSSEQHR